MEMLVVESCGSPHEDSRRLQFRELCCDRFESAVDGAELSAIEWLLVLVRGGNRPELSAEIKVSNGGGVDSGVGGLLELRVDAFGYFDVSDHNVAQSHGRFAEAHRHPLVADDFLVAVVRRQRE